MQFNIEIYKAKNGREYVQELLDELETRNLELFGAVLSRIKLLENSQYHKLPFCRNLKGGLLELRSQVGRSICRINWCFAKGKKIILLNGCLDKNKQNDSITKARSLIREIEKKGKNEKI